eukprot:Nk52_evm1s420 gene=Nk52_evmTU1s420
MKGGLLVVVALVVALVQVEEGVCERRMVLPEGERKEALSGQVRVFYEVQGETLMVRYQVEQGMVMDKGILEVDMGKGGVKEYFLNDARVVMLWEPRQVWKQADEKKEMGKDKASIGQCWVEFVKGGEVSQILRFRKHKSDKKALTLLVSSLHEEEGKKEKEVANILHTSSSHKPVVLGTLDPRVRVADVQVLS